MFGKNFILLKIIRKMNTKYFHGFVIKINTFYATECYLNPIQNINTHNFTIIRNYPQFYNHPKIVKKENQGELMVAVKNITGFLSCFWLIFIFKHETVKFIITIKEKLPGKLKTYYVEPKSS